MIDTMLEGFDGHDEGLSHDHGWARESVGTMMGSAGPSPCRVHLATMSTPSCTTHDDALYA